MDRIVNDKCIVAKIVNAALAPARVARAEEALTSVATIMQPMGAGANAKAIELHASSYMTMCRYIR